MQTTDKAGREDKWQPARLIPTSGIKGVDEQERRATSALLSVMMAVPEFSKALLRKAGAPAGTLKTYLECSFDTPLGTKIRPDGAILIRRGGTQWSALVEVKTGVNDLGRDQIEGYLDLARDEGFDAVITISNQMNTAVESVPLTVDKRKVRKVALHHYSWVEVLTEAMVQREFRGVSDTDQAWILGELIAYLQHPQSGAMEFQDMGVHWATVRDAVRDGSLRPNDPGAADVVTRWDQFMQYLSLFLMRDLGVKVSQVLSRRQMDPAVRRGELLKELTELGSLTGTLRVQRAAGDILLSANLRARNVAVSVGIDAPNDRRASARVNWLLKQLGAARDDARIDVWYPGIKYPISNKLKDLKEEPKLALAQEKAKECRSFTITQVGEMGSKRAGTQGSFIGQASSLLLDFYRDVVQQLRPWSAAAARLPEERDTEDAATQPESIVEQVAQEQSELRSELPL